MTSSINTTHKEWCGYNPDVSLFRDTFTIHINGTNPDRVRCPDDSGVGVID